MVHNLDAEGTLADSRTCYNSCASGKEPTANAGDLRDVGSIPGSERSPGEGNGNLLQYSCLKNSMDRGTWQTVVHQVAKESHRT